MLANLAAGLNAEPPAHGAFEFTGDELSSVSRLEHLRIPRATQEGL